MLFGNVYPLEIYRLGQFLMPPYLCVFMCSLGIKAGHFALDHLCLHWGNLDTLLSQTCSVELSITIRLCWRWADNLWRQLFGTVWGSSWPKWVCNECYVYCCSQKSVTKGEHWNEERSGKHSLSGKVDFLPQQRLDEGKHNTAIQT